MDEIYAYPENDYCSFLEHHGIAKQKWGVRHGPPYPLDYEDHSPAQKKAMREAAREQKRSNKATLKGERADKYREAHTIPVGTKIYRTSVRNNEDTNGIKYVSYLDADRNHYKGGWIRQIGNADKAFEYEYELKEDLKVPSRSELSSVVNSVIKSNPTFVPKTVNAWLDMCMPEGSENRYYESVDNQGNYDKKKWDGYVKDCEKKYKNMPLNEAYYYTAQTFGKNKEVRAKVIDELKKRGYNAMVDEASVGGQNGYKKEGIDPLIVFDGSVLNTTNVKEISKREEAKAKKADDKFERNSNRQKSAQWGLIFEDEKAMIMYPENDYRSFLEHHGIPGQKWGVRKAAWYPISAFQNAKATVGSKVAEFRQKRAAEKKRKQRVANLAKAREARAKKIQEEKDFAEEKKRILTSGTPGEVVKIASKLTNEELKEAVARNASLETLRNAEKKRVKEIEDAEYEKKWGKIDKIAKTVDKVGGYAKTASTAYSNIKGIFDLFGDKNKDNNGGDNKPDGQKKDNQKKDKGADNKEKAQSKENKESVKQKPGVEEFNNHNDKNQRAEFKSRVVDGDWSEIVTPENVSTALSVVSKAMNIYDSAKSSRAVSNGMKFLEQKNYANLILEPGADDDDRRR